MLQKLLSIIKDAIRKMVAYRDVADTISDKVAYTISTEMSDAIELWRSVYKDESPWLNENEGVFSLGLGKLIPQILSVQVLTEMQTSIVVPGKANSNNGSNEDDLSTRAGFLHSMYKKNLMNKLPENLEKAMALGGVIIKPYVANDRIYFDFCFPGQFYPLEFDDDGNIIDIAFIDQFIREGKQYTRVERQIFINNTVTILNKAFIAPDRSQEDDVEQELGTEIKLESVDRWAQISEEVTITDVDRPLYGYYRVPLANNIDLECPLGVSVFSPATKVIERADKQFSRLDWEYDGGQLAIDVDPTACKTQETYYGSQVKMDKLRDRLYRKLDLGQDDTYKEFAPSLRDANYLNGLTRYLCIIEDLVGLSRGTLSGVTAEARTATEIKILKQRSFATIASHQTALDQVLKDAVYAMNVLVTLYNLVAEGEYSMTLEWSDSILTDTDTELNQRMMLVDAKILDRAEVRAWYRGEDLETAKKAIEEIDKKDKSNMLPDIFSQMPEQTLEE